MEQTNSNSDVEHVYQIYVHAHSLEAITALYKGKDYDKLFVHPDGAASFYSRHFGPGVSREEMFEITKQVVNKYPDVQVDLLEIEQRKGIATYNAGKFDGEWPNYSGVIRTLATSDGAGGDLDVFDRAMELGRFDGEFAKKLMFHYEFSVFASDPDQLREDVWAADGLDLPTEVTPEVTQTADGRFELPVMCHPDCDAAECIEFMTALCQKYPALEVIGYETEEILSNEPLSYIDNDSIWVIFRGRQPLDKRELLANNTGGEARPNTPLL
jgi:hypothetical protein